METNSSIKSKCEFCEQNFNKNQLTESFNRIYNHLCPKCKEYIESRATSSHNCSNYCLDSGKCDGSC